jgi:hypothetical protein
MLVQPTLNQAVFRWSGADFALDGRIKHNLIARFLFTQPFAS